MNNYAYKRAHLLSLFCKKKLQFMGSGTELKSFQMLALLFYINVYFRGQKMF